MTLILTVNGPESIWMLADRRLSSKGRPPKDDARKIMLLETTDGVAILGYAGLGATALGTEPADWMSAVVRGRSLSLEQSLGVLAEAIKKQLPRHIVQMQVNGGPAHNVIVSAFLGDEPRLYTIDLVFSPNRKNYRFRFTRHVNDKATPGTPRPPRLGLGGTGARYLVQDKKWIRNLLRMIRAYDRGQVSSLAVSDHLANLNNEVHLGILDKSVGPHCIVAWRHSKGGFHKDGGGQQFYIGATRDTSSPFLPTIANGMDIPAIVRVIMPHITKGIDAMRADQQGKELDKDEFKTKMREAMRADQMEKELDKDEINAALARLPDKPDETLR